MRDMARRRYAATHDTGRENATRRTDTLMTASAVPCSQTTQQRKAPDIVLAVVCVRGEVTQRVLLGEHIAVDILTYATT